MASNLPRGKTICVAFILMHSDCTKYGHFCRAVRRFQAFPYASGWMAGRRKVSDLADLASRNLLQEVLWAHNISFHFRKRPMNLCNPVLGYFSILEKEIQSN